MRPLANAQFLRCRFSPSQPRGTDNSGHHNVIGHLTAMLSTSLTTIRSLSHHIKAYVVLIKDDPSFMCNSYFTEIQIAAIKMFPPNIR